MALQQQYAIEETGLVVDQSYARISGISISDMMCNINVEIYLNESARQSRSPLKMITVLRPLDAIEMQVGDNLIAKTYALLKSTQFEFTSSTDV
jgi:hypothetical protein